MAATTNFAATERKYHVSSAGARPSVYYVERRYPNAADRSRYTETVSEPLSRWANARRARSEAERLSAEWERTGR